VPARHKVKLHSQKWILKKALSDRIPAEVRNRRKVGFPTPIIALFRGTWGLTAADQLMNPSSTTAGLFDRARIEQMITEHRKSRNDWSRQLFQLLMLTYWAHEGERLDAAAKTSANTIPVCAV
jgi:asparagine synthase (glutamine-hydrolysing)